MATGAASWQVEGSHTLEKFVNGVARDIEDPGDEASRCGSVCKRRALAERRRDASGRTRASRADLRIGALGSGSDYTAFLDHLGIASLNMGFGGEDGGGIYHSIYDDFYWYTHFADTDFVYGRALAQTAGTAVMRLADAELLPLRFRRLHRHASAATSTRCRNWRATSASRSSSAIARSTRAFSQPWSTIRGSKTTVRRRRSRCRRS